jgi:hypothetical protein
VDQTDSTKYLFLWHQQALQCPHSTHILIVAESKKDFLIFSEVRYLLKHLLVTIAKMIWLATAAITLLLVCLDTHLFVFIE